MARFHKLPAISRNLEDEARREALELDNLPVETKISFVYIDLDRVESFAPSDDEEYDYTELILHSGLHVVIAMSISEMKKLICG